MHLEVIRGGWRLQNGLMKRGGGSLECILYVFLITGSDESSFTDFSVNFQIIECLAPATQP